MMQSMPETEISLSNTVSVPDGVMFRELDGEAVILNVNTEHYFGLDEVGTRIWMVLTTAESIQAGIETLLEEYDVERDRLENDIRELLAQLIEHGLIALG